MTVYVCVDDQGGILFNNRRVSSDRVVIRDVLQQCASQPLRMRPYSAKLFPENSAVMVDDAYLKDAKQNDHVFLEDAASADLFGKAKRIVVYHWNRLYPSDVKFPLNQLRKLGKLESSADFSGHSHDKITREVYSL